MAAFHRLRRRQLAGVRRAASVYARPAPLRPGTDAVDPGGLSRRAVRRLSCLPAPWVERITDAQRLLAGFARRPQSPLDWAELVPRLLDELHFATARPLASAEYQAFRRWQQAVESCGSLGFDGRRMSWKEFLSQLGRALDETLFAPESRNAPIQIAGPAESAGLTADAVWFLGADEDAWPASGTTHPLLPIEVQREAGMPHATPQLDWELADAITRRILASAHEVHFSFARQNEAAEARPSRLIVAACRRGAEVTAGADSASRAASAHSFLRGPQPHSLPSGQGQGRRRRSHRAVAVPLQGLRHRAPRRARLGARRGRPDRLAARQPAPRRAAFRLGRAAGGHSHSR